MYWLCKKSAMPWMLPMWGAQVKTVKYSKRKEETMQDDLHILRAVCVYVCSCAQSCQTLCYPMDCSPPDSFVHGIFQAIILGCHVLLQGIFLIQGSNLHPWGLLHWQTDSLPLCCLGSLQLFIQVYSLERVLDSRYYIFSSHQHLGCIYILQKDEIKSLQMVIAAMKVKDTYSLEGKLLPTWITY